MSQHLQALRTTAANLLGAAITSAVNPARNRPEDAAILAFVIFSNLESAARGGVIDPEAMSAAKQAWNAWVGAEMEAVKREAEAMATESVAKGLSGIFKRAAAEAADDWKHPGIG